MHNSAKHYLAEINSLKWLKTYFIPGISNITFLIHWHQFFSLILTFKVFFLQIKYLDIKPYRSTCDWQLMSRFTSNLNRSMAGQWSLVSATVWWGHICSNFIFLCIYKILILRWAKLCPDINSFHLLNSPDWDSKKFLLYWNNKKGFNFITV